MEYDVEKPIWEHITELSERLKVIVLVVAAAAFILGVIPARPLDPSSYKGNYTTLVSYVISKLEKKMLPEGAEIIAGGWMDVLTVYLTASLVLGFLAASPVVAYEIWKYISPALYRHERKLIAYFILGFIALFALGGVYAFYIIVPITARVIMWLAVKGGATPVFTLKEFMNFLFLAVVATGLFFNFPLILLVLVKAGVVDTKTLSSNTRKVFLAVLILTAVLTPDPSPISMLLLSIPFMGLYLVVIFLGRRIEKGEAT